MEKQRYNSRCQFGRRLLVFFGIIFCIFARLNAKNLTAEEINRLSFFVSSGQSMVTNSDIKFFLEIPNVSPTEVEIFSSVEMEDVEFISSRRIQMEDNNQGTVVEIWYSFSKKGVYQLMPMNLRIQGRFCQIKFEPVEIFFNPKEQSPVIVINFENGITLSSDKENFSQFKSDIEKLNVICGRKLKFTVYFQYGIQLSAFNWEIPKDSIFIQTKTYSILDNKYIDNNRNDELIPVSDFEWQPLVEGKMDFPSINMIISSFTGNRTEVLFPSFQINVVKDTEEKNSIEKDYFKEAFEEVNKTVIEDKKYIITKDDCQKLADLRIKERHSIFGFARSKRIAFEQSIGIRSNSDEFKLFYIYLALFLVALSVFLFFFLLRKKKFFYNVGTVFLMIFSIGLLITVILNANIKHAVSKGCILYSIPEESAESKSDLLPGSYVEIKERNVDWIYVNVGESGGWCKIDDFIFIE